MAGRRPGARGHRAARRRHRRADPAAVRAAGVRGRRGAGRPACTSRRTPPTWSSASARRRRALGGPPVPIHLKVDTGMHRVGAAPADALGAGRRPSTSHPALDLAAVWTHCAVADEPDDPFTALQLERYEAVLAELAAAGIEVPLRHAANSAGAIAHPAARYDLVRCGIAIYGIPPAPALAGAVPLQPAVRLATEVAFVKRVPAGDGISYGLRHHLERDTVIATLPIGYADGVFREPRPAGQDVLIGGRRCPMVGVVTMDQVMVDVGPDAEVRAGRRGGAARAPRATSGSRPTSGPPGSTRSPTRWCAPSGRGSSADTRPLEAVGTLRRWPTASLRGPTSATSPTCRKPGVGFKDITPLLADPAAFAAVVDELVRPLHGPARRQGRGHRGPRVRRGGAGRPPARGGLRPVRKVGKLPWTDPLPGVRPRVRHRSPRGPRRRDPPGERVVVIDDVIATGGTAAAAAAARRAPRRRGGRPGVHHRAGLPRRELPGSRAAPRVPAHLRRSVARAQRPTTSPVRVRCVSPASRRVLRGRDLHGRHPRRRAGRICRARIRVDLGTRGRSVTRGEPQPHPDPDRLEGRALVRRDRPRRPLSST